MADWKAPIVSTLGQTMEQEQALRDAQQIIRERGKSIIIRPYTETKIVRDKYNSIIKRTTASVTSRTFFSFPIIFNPTTKQMEDAGIREKTDLLLKTATQDWLDFGFTMETLKDIDTIRMTVIIENSKYEIQSKQFDSQYNDTWLYVHLGANLI